MLRFDAVLFEDPKRSFRSSYVGSYLFMCFSCIHVSLFLLRLKSGCVSKSAFFAIVSDKRHLSVFHQLEIP